MLASLKVLLFKVATGDHTVLVAKLTNSKQVFSRIAEIFWQNEANFRKGS